ncbi:MAG: hypothetical protein WD851_19665 [Pirellulales bacterium]
MATQLPTDAEVFYDFLGHQIENGGRENSPEELLAYWRQEHAEAVEDIRQGLRNMEAGLGRPFEEVDAEMWKKYGV